MLSAIPVFGDGVRKPCELSGCQEACPKSEMEIRDSVGLGHVLSIMLFGEFLSVEYMILGSPSTLLFGDNIIIYFVFGCRWAFLVGSGCG